MFIYATDKEHGLAFDDTIGFTDENGEAYEAFRSARILCLSR